MSGLTSIYFFKRLKLITYLKGFDETSQVNTN